MAKISRDKIPYNISDIGRDVILEALRWMREKQREAKRDEKNKCEK